MEKKMGCVLFGTQVIRNHVAPLTTGYVLGGQSDLVANERRRRLFRGAHFRAFFYRAPIWGTNSGIAILRRVGCN